MQENAMAETTKIENTMVEKTKVAPYVIIGGDGAGMSAASKIMREQADAHVIVFERSQHISYSACGMPYWIGGVVASDRKLIVLTPEVARKKRGIDVRIHHEVIAIDPAQHSVHVINQKTGETFIQPYAKLCIATGARAIAPPIPGMDHPGVFTLRALTDAQRIYAYMQEHDMKTAVVIGGGYIGIEMVEAMRDRELEVHLVEMQPQIMPNYDLDMVKPITAQLRESKVQLHLGIEVKEIKTHAGRLAIHTDKAGVIHADIVIVSVGVRPNAELAAAAGLRLGESTAIHVDRHLRTSAPDIFAAGDCVEHHHLVLERDVWIPLATSANKGGRIAGENMLGGNATLPGILGTAIVKVFDYSMAITGMTEVDARKSGLFGKDGEFVGSTVIETNDRSSYWPGVAMLMIKLVFDKRGGRVVGSQMVGKDGVNKRIDIVATAITAKMTLIDITTLDLSYAPPYSTTHDPIQICASVAQRELISEPVT
jgi:NADPH-dependent 2,4-dienoyl-CoA reductase/sulfur reductase-like enzyme